MDGGSDGSTVWRLWRIRRTVLEMCKDRGYYVGQEELEQTLEAFRDAHGGNPSRADLQFVVQKMEDLNTPSAEDNSKNMLFILFPDDPKVGVKPVQQYFDRMQSEGVTKAILVVQTGLTPFAKQAIAEMAPKYVMEQFLETELLVNITKHDLVPEHQVLKDIEKTELLKKYKLMETQLPRIQVGDPVSRYFGLRRGQVVKIKRKSETAGSYVTYRLVV